MSTKHSKYKNVGILYELLTRQLTTDILEGKEQSRALDLLQEFFKPNTELGKELILYRTLMVSDKLTENKASRLVDLVIKQHQKLNNRKLNEQKYNLVKKINDTYPLKEFLAVKIPEYKVYASIYKTMLAECAPASIDIHEIAEVANARFTLTEYLTTKTIEKKPDEMSIFREQPEDVRLITYKILIERFNQKYSELNQPQKMLLREYINNVSTTNTLRAYINSEIPKIKEDIKVRIKKIPNRATQIKLHEVTTQLDGLTKGKTVKDSHITALLTAYEMIKEIDETIK